MVRDLHEDFHLSQTGQRETRCQLGVGCHKWLSFRWHIQRQPQTAVQAAISHCGLSHQPLHKTCACTAQIQKNDATPSMTEPHPPHDSNLNGALQCVTKADQEACQSRRCNERRKLKRLSTLTPVIESNNNKCNDDVGMKTRHNQNFFFCSGRRSRLTTAMRCW